MITFSRITELHGCTSVCVCVTLGVFLLGVVCECSSHTEAHVTVFAVVRLLACVQPHVILQGRVGAKLCATVVASERFFLKVLGALVVDHSCNTTQGTGNPTQFNLTKIVAVEL